MSDKYAAISKHREQYPVRMMCDALEVSTSGYYAAVARAEGPPSTHTVVDAQLRLHVRAAYTKSHRRYGAPRVHLELHAQGIAVAKKRVARLMQEDQLVARCPRRSVVTTMSAPDDPIAPNLLARRFDVADHPVPDRAWVGDMTYVPTRAGWLYLAVLIDLASRVVVGWATGLTLATALPLAAWHHALHRRNPAPGLLQHTDRGSQYASLEYRSALAAHRAVQSMSRKGDCYDNAVAESFFATLEHELLRDADFHSHREAQQAIFEFIEHWYNPERRHSTLGYVSPLQYEHQLRQMARAA